MTSRERFIQTLTFGQPDRVPFSPGGPRESTLKAWWEQGLPEGVDWFDFLCEQIGMQREKTQPYIDPGVDFRMIPQFEEKVLERKDGHYVVQDWKGNICEISDAYDVTYLRMAKDFVTRRWIKCPVENRDDWEQMKARYAIDTPGRFPADFAQRCEKLAARDFAVTVWFNGPFWQLREWCGFENLCMLMIEDPEFVEDMAAFWTNFVAGCLERILVRVAPDQIHISEDMAYKAHAMISPAMTRHFCMPSYVRWAKMAKAAGLPLVGMDSDGYVGDLIPIWIESGINVCDPVEVAAHCDINEFRRRFGKQMAYRGGVDKRAMARGGADIRAELKRIEPVLRDGGYIPSCDHGVPADVSWPNFVEYSRLLARMTGW
ncbi:MAG TPA: uroporphyrinogen decarboxylase family protein [Planctomycetota bacterium]|jgi:uroporphyrinogen decarboxylase